jgi:hypothetical protein
MERISVMKNICLLLGAGLISGLAGCATPVALAPVGPDSAGFENPSASGKLVVYSSLAVQSDDQNQGSRDPVWHQHTDYSISDLQGNRVRHVDNTIGHYEEAPRRVVLPAGKYLVKARANDYLTVMVPVRIECGRTTTVHLDDNWNMPAGVPVTAVVSLPNGQAVGWRASSTNANNLN